MKWENLQESKCPHCGGELYTDGTERRCVDCRFIIDIERAESIVRRRVARAIPKLKWQNLHDGKCPICGVLLESVRSRYTQYPRLVCMNTEGCTFSMRQDRIDAIIDDPEHSANRYRDIAEHH